MLQETHIVQLDDRGVAPISTLGERLRELRQKRSEQNGRLITCEEVAKAVGVSASSMYMYERGERVPLSETLAALADYYGVSTDYILGRSDRGQDREVDNDRRPLSPTDQLRQLGAMLRGAGATQEDVNTIMGLLEHRRKLREASEGDDSKGK